jgi:hypothetical protein
MKASEEWQREYGFGCVEKIKNQIILDSYIE